MNETAKATRRRLSEEASGGFKWSAVLRGTGIDVGCGPDLLKHPPGCIPWDEKDGDANVLSTFWPPNHFDYVHASQCLEHMHDPNAAIRDWLKIVKPGGHLVFTVPDWVAYEGMRWPSKYNPDHKSSWSMCYRGSIAPIHVHVPTFTRKLEEERLATCLLQRFVDSNYDYKIGMAGKDQTWEEEDMVECWIEVVLQRL